MSDHVLIPYAGSEIRIPREAWDLFVGPKPDLIPLKSTGDWKPSFTEWDGCTGVPDVFLGVDLRMACYFHDYQTRFRKTAITEFWFYRNIFQAGRLQGKGRVKMGVGILYATGVRYFMGIRNRMPGRSMRVKTLLAVLVGLPPVLFLLFVLLYPLVRAIL